MDTDVLAAVDFSAVTDRVVQTAVRLAESLGGRVWLVHVTPHDTEGVGFRDTIAANLRHEHRELQDIERDLHRQGVDATAMLIGGKPSREIVRKARHLRAAFIVLGSHGHGSLFQFLMGSVSKAVLQHAPCPIAVVPSQIGKKDDEVRGVGIQSGDIP